MSGYIQEVYSPIPMAAGATLQLQPGTEKLGGFLATVAGSITVTTEKGVILLNAMPVAVGFNKIPMAIGYNCTIILATAAGTLLVS